MRHVALVLLALSVTATDLRTIAANGVKMEAPSGWRRVAPAEGDRFADPRTVLVVGSAGVRSRASRCQIAAYRIPPTGAAVVVVRWRTATSGGGSPPRSREPLRRIVLRRGGLECFSGRSGIAQLTLARHAYQLNVMVGDRATSRRVAEALAVARSFNRTR